MNPYLPVYFVIVFSLFLLLAVFYKKRSSSTYLKSLFSSVLKNIDEAVIGVNSELNIEFANSAAERLFKYEEKTLVNSKIDNLFDNYGREQITQTTMAINCLDANKNKFPASVKVAKVHDKSKRLIGYAYTIKDITEIKSYIKSFEEKSAEIEQENINLNLLQQELDIERTSSAAKVEQRTRVFEEEHARLLASINNLSLGFIMTDQYKNILLSNNGAANFLPSLKNKPKPPTIANLQSSEQMNCNLEEEIEKSITEKKIINVNDALVNSKFVKIFISPIVLEKSEDIIGVIILIEDVNAQHALEESKEDLFSIASHELRTPLTAIYGYTSLIKQIYFDDLKDAELKNIINNVGVLSKKLSLSINNFLDSSKLEQDKIELKKEACDLYAIINDAIKETERSALEKNLYIKFDFPQSPITIIGDQARMIQVLIILLSNAIKFTQIGGIRVKVELQLESVKISVQDTGSGIAEENKKLIFSKFQQTEENLLTKQEGAGLGLHIAKLLVEKMGGNIWIEKTEVNKGTTFSFVIPIASS